MKPTRLFSDYDLFAILENQKSKVRDEASKVPSGVLLEGIDVAAERVAEVLGVKPLELIEDEVSIDQEETKVDVSRDPMRAIMDRSRPFYIDGIQVSFYVPFTGESELWKCRPNQWTSVQPYAEIGKNEIVLRYRVLDGNIAPTKSSFEKDLSEIKSWLNWQEEMIDRYNSGLAALARPFLESRLSALKTSQNQIGDLGYAIRQGRQETEVSASPNPTAKTVASKRSGTGSKAAKQSYDVALSFAGEDREYVDRVAKLLQDRGVNVFYDRFETAQLWGKNLVDHLGEVYSKQSRFIVMFISKHYAIKSWPTYERKSAQDRAVRMNEECILPARFDDTDLPGMPSSVGYVDLRDTEPVQLVELIIEKISF